MQFILACRLHPEKYDFIAKHKGNPRATGVNKKKMIWKNIRGILFAKRFQKVKVFVTSFSKFKMNFYLILRGEKDD